MIKGFAPSLTMTLCVLLSLVLLVGLGSWQVKRLFWKQELIARFEANIAAPVIDWMDFEPMWKMGPKPQEEFRRVRMTGVLLREHEMYLTGRSSAGEPGLYILAPMRFANGQEILVNLGWVESDYRNQKSVALFTEPSTIEGMFRIARKPTGIKAWVLPENDTVKNTWYILDMEMMKNHTGLENLNTSFYIKLIHEGEVLPTGKELKIHNAHLEYALTWYGLALALLVMYIMFGIQRAKELAQ